MDTSQESSTQIHEALMREFWKLADSARTQTEYVADDKLHRLADAPLHVLKKLFTQYRYFTRCYITDLALLVAKLPFGELRSLLAEFLSDELGNGDSRAGHERLYDDFLLSLGLDQREIESPPSHGNRQLLGELNERISTRSVAYAVGLRGMGGECLCQVYLTAMHSHFTKNPAIHELKDQMSWTFWDIHIGEVDISHREKLKAAIQSFAARNPEQLRDLVQGYKDAKEIFDSYWGNIYAEHFGGQYPPS
jgi:hypothetical protein